MMTRLILIRHGAPQQRNSLLGKTDSPLSEEGIQQLVKTSARLPEFDRIISSPLKRCLSFASKLANSNHCDLVIDSVWEECDFGDWDGVSYQELAKQRPKKYAEFLMNPFVNCPPNAETLEHFFKRVQQGIKKLVSQYSGETLVLVTHGGVIRCILAWCLQLDLKTKSSIAFQRIKVDYASMTQIDIWKEDSLLPQLVLLNQTDTRVS